VGVTLICGKEEFMPLLEPDMRAALRARMVRDRVLIVHEEVQSIQLEEQEQAPTQAPTQARRGAGAVQAGSKGVTVVMAPNPLRPTVQRRFKVDMLLYSGGRDANSEGRECTSMHGTCL
jgi:hypothetical protein